jgi:hypothetical protein
MDNVTWKAAVTILAILGCPTLALRAGKPHATPVSSPAISGAPSASNNVNAPQFGLDSQCASAVPRSWGQYRGSSAQSGLAFEASDGLLRFVTNLPCGATPVIALDVRRTPAASGNSPN